MDYLDRLFVGLLGTRAVAVFNHRMHEQPAVASEERPVFGFHDAEQLSIIRTAIISHVKTEQAQIAHKFAKMPVCHKPSNCRALATFVLEVRVSSSWRINLDLGIARQAVIKIDRLPIEQDQTDLRMRHTARFDDIFYRGFLS